MSKAFTKEDGAGGEEVLPLRPRAPSGERRPITPEGWRALQEELAALGAPAPPEEEEGEAALAREVRVKERARRAEQLAATLEAVQVVASEGAAEGRAVFGAWVTLEEDGSRVTYRLVGPDEADVRAGRLGVDAPLARALLGKEEGEQVHLERPRGAVDYTLVRARLTPPEDEGLTAPSPPG